MGVLTRLLAAVRSVEPEREPPTKTAVQLVSDWPRAVSRPVVAPDPDAGFRRPCLGRRRAAVDLRVAR